MLRPLLKVALAVLVLSSLTAAAPGSIGSPAPEKTILPTPAGPAGPAGGDGDLAPGQAEYRIPIGGCSAMVSCPTGGTVRCVSWWANGCVQQQGANPPWVACDGVVKSCPGLL